MSTDLRHSTVATNGVTLHVVESGPEDGPPVILLHGFPEAWLCWRRQIGPLAAAGYRVIVPDQRGYNTSEKPLRIAAYVLDELAADVLGLITHTGHDRAALVGHDWGGIVAWRVAIRHAGRVDRLAIVNAPHPWAFRRYLVRNPAQWLRSWYVFFFQLPRVPEANFRRANWRALARALVATSRPGTFGEHELDEYRDAWAQPGAMTAMIHWYRAALRYPPPEANPRVRIPTLILWGRRDTFIRPSAAEASLALCENGRLEWFDDATHWLQHEQPEEVAKRLLEFLATA
jgi:pimeloyl-ACP methyl ester carboxylesterase